MGKHFVEENELVQNFNAWLESGTTQEDRQVGDGLALNIWTIAKHLTEHHRFSRYNQNIKDDMVSDAYIKCVKNLKNIDTSKGTIFNYLTRCCWTAFVVYLSNHYKDINKKKQLMLDYLEDMRATNPLLNQDIINNLQKELEQYEEQEEED